MVLNTKPPKPKFEFYTMLPEMEVAVPDEELVPLKKETAAAPGSESATRSGSYVVQVASFRRREEADGLKAKLAFLGLEAVVQSVSINGEDSWFRVRLGPYANLDVLGQARIQLRANGYDSMVLRVKEG